MASEPARTLHLSITHHDIGISRGRTFYGRSHPDPKLLVKRTYGDSIPSAIAMPRPRCA